MDIFRIAKASLLIASLILVGCDNKTTDGKADVPNHSTTVNEAAVLTPQFELGDTKQYWIQSYSSVSKDKIDWSNKAQRLGAKALVSYQVKEANKHQLMIDVTTNHIELIIKDNAAYLNPVLQTVLTDGLTYQLNLDSDKPLLIRPKNQQIMKQITDTKDLSTEYKYLQALLMSPFLPNSLPLSKGQQTTIPHFMQMEELTVVVDDITTASIHLTLQASQNESHLYGRAVFQRDTGWLERLALIKETPVEGQPDYKMRTLLLVGPSSWSSNNSRQLINEMQIKNTQSYLQPFTVFDFSAEQWQQAQKQEQNNQLNQGNLYTLTNPDGSSQLMLVTNSYTDSINQRLGSYQATHLVLSDKNDKILPNDILLPTTNIAYKIKTPNGIETNLLSYKLALGKPDTNKIKLEDIARMTADVSFTPYQLEKITLPLTNTMQTAASSDHNFTVDISPTDQAKNYILHWQQKDNIIFNPQLMQGVDNALVQYIQPDTVSWLSPAETRLINSVTNGFENRIKIAFTTTPPKNLILYIIKENSALNTTNGTITFIRHP